MLLRVPVLTGGEGGMAKESVNHEIKQIISAVDKFLITDYGSYNREQLGAEGGRSGGAAQPEKSI